MRVLNYLEFATRLERSGIYTAAAQQRKALAGSSIEVVADPWIGDGAIGRITTGLRRGRLFDRYDIAHLHLFGPASIAVESGAGRAGAFPPATRRRPGPEAGGLQTWRVFTSP